MGTRLKLRPSRVMIVLRIVGTLILASPICSIARSLIVDVALHVPHELGFILPLGEGRGELPRLESKDGGDALPDSKFSVLLP